MKGKMVYIALALLAAFILIPLFSGKLFGTSFSSLAEKCSTRFGEEIARYAAKYGVPSRRVSAIVIAESAVKERAIGSSGERGLMQLMQGAVSDVNRIYGHHFTWEDMFNPLKNIECGTAYLAHLYRQTQSIDAATQAYNAGLRNYSLDKSKGSAYLARVKQIESFI